MPVTATALAAGMLTLTSAAVAAGGDEFFDFQPYVTYAAGLFSTGLDAADIDGDGDLDLAISNRSSHNVSVRFNLGDGTFPAVTHHAVGLEPRYVVTDDFNGDGWPDFATADRLGNSVTVRLNDGTGGFGPAATIGATLPTWLDAGDLDDDGDVDIVVTECDAGGCGEPALLTWLENDSRGGFTPIQSVPIGILPRGGAIADLDDDGTLDVAVANLTSNTVSVVLNTGLGALASATDLPAGAGPRYLVAADLVGDAAIDLAVVHKDGDDLWIFPNAGRADFATLPVIEFDVHNEPHSVATADLDGDGRQEIIVSHVVATVWVDIFHNVSDGVFERQSIPSPTGGSHVIAADLDADGDVDIATTASAGRVAVYLNDTPQHCRADLDDSGGVGFADLLTLLASWGPCVGDCVADLDGNGVVDFVDLLTMLSTWGPC
ncbi:MAG: VCBS repeat-containing protein [Phycisphaerales bacterium]|nr:VCBS repeat-containing protein [Phycisphaerales bacterium]